MAQNRERKKRSRKLEMGGRVVEFSQAHPSDDASQGSVLAKLEERIARADVLITQQRGGQIAVHAATARRKELRRGLQFQLLRYLIRVGEAAAKVRPELAMRFELPALNTAQKPFLSSVKAMLSLTETEREFLISVGLSELALTDLKREVGEFEEAIEAGHAGRSDHVGASADLGVVASEVLDLVGMLDGLNRYRFRNDAELLAAWESVSRVRPFRPKEEEPAVVSGEVVPRSRSRLPVGIPSCFMIIGSSAGTVMLVGPLEIWEGVRRDLEWSPTPKQVPRALEEPGGPLIARPPAPLRFCRDRDPRLADFVPSRPPMDGQKR